MNRLEPKATVAAMLRSARPRILQLGPAAVEAVDMGEGPAVLSLHGAMGGWDQGLLLARSAFADWRQRRILSPSRPAYRGTPLESGRTPEQQADLFAALLDHAGIDRAVVVAVSGGGPSAIQFAVRHPDRCQGLVLVSACSERLEIPPEYRDRFDRMVRLANLAPFRWLMAAMGRLAPDKAIRASVLDEAVRRRTLADPQAGPLIRALQTSTMTRLAERMPGMLNDTRNCEAAGSLPLEKVAVPVLLLHGTADRVVPFRHATDALARLPRAELLSFEGGEHVSLFTHLAEARAAVAGFAARL